MQNFSLFGSYPSNPNEKTQNEYTDWNAKVSGTVDAGWGLRVTPVLKMQSGAPYGRFFQTRAGELNYGAQIILAEPIGTRRQDTVMRAGLPRREAAALRRRSRASSGCSSTCSTR